MRFFSRIARCVSLSAVLLIASFAITATLPASPDAVTPDGGRYFGSLVDGKLHGHGRIVWANGAEYDGEFVAGQFSGKGRMRLASGDVYEGQYKAGSMSGRGRSVLLDGSVYEGEYRDDYFNGHGKYTRPDGEIYEGNFKNGEFHGKGRHSFKAASYQGDFRHSMFWGVGESTDAGGKYKGEFVRGKFHGRGRFENPVGEVYEGDFVEGEFVGRGVHTGNDGSRREGTFAKWLLTGKGKFADGRGTTYEGAFVDGALEGTGTKRFKDGARYAGEFSNWQPHGRGELRLANGDYYIGGFARGLYEGEGILTFSKPHEGRARESGVWRAGELPETAAEKKGLRNLETALYQQRRLLDKSLAALAPRDPARINLYMLSVAGDGSQEVFRREVEFVRDQFATRFGVKGHSLELINSRTTLDKVPMATLTSIGESLNAIAARMDKETDILFLFLTSHGSEEHELSLAQNGMSLRGLAAKELGRMLKASGIRWKVVVVSACYGGGFIDAVKDDHTLILTAARRDRMSFGCEDDNDFTYFGRAFFKDSLPTSNSFQDAFRKAEMLIKDWERKDVKNAVGKIAEKTHSMPQMLSPAPVEDYLRRWWAETVGKP